MPDDPLAEVYWKNEASAYVTANLLPTIDVLQQMANYGSNLIPRAWLSSRRKVKDTVLIAVLFKHTLVMLDSVVVQLREGCVLPALLQVRSLYEAHVYIRWILKADTEERANHYFVAHLRQELEWVKVAKGGTGERDRLRDELDNSSMDSTFDYFDGMTPQILEKESTLDQILASDSFAATNAAFEKARLTKKGKRKNSDVTWYSLSGPQSFRDVCEELNLLGEYALFYSSDSEVMHASTQGEMVTHKDGNLVFEPIRDLSKFHEVAKRASLMMLRVFRIILTEYREGEVDVAFRNRYINEWKSALDAIRPVETGHGGYKTI